MPQKTCLVIAGPTASGKTALAIKLAQHFKTAIISADSRQCFRELNIGVAKPSEAELQMVPHYFIDTHSITDNVNAATFEEYALDAVGEIFQDTDVAIMAGGTGLYIKAFCEGLDDMPVIPPGIREEINRQYTVHGLAWLQQEVAERDPEYYAGGELLNPRRLMRALEVIIATGKSIRYFQEGEPVKRPFRIVKAGLELPRETLYENINRRVDQMLQQGLEQEVAELWSCRHLNALQTVGYTELFDYMAGDCTLESAIVNIKKNTRHYAKRQMTWLRKDTTVRWFNPNDTPGIIDYCQA